MDFPNGFSGADAAFAPYTQFNSAGQVTGGYGMVSLITNRSHSSYHALQMSAQQNLTASGLGLQASYTLSKSIDDASAVIGGFISGASGQRWRRPRRKTRSTPAWTRGHPVST